MAVDDEAPKRAKYEQTYTQGRCKGLGQAIGMWAWDLGLVSGGKSAVKAVEMC